MFYARGAHDSLVGEGLGGVIRIIQCRCARLPVVDAL